MRYSTTRHGCLELIISEDSNWSEFDRLAGVIRDKFGARIVKRLDGLDQRYWDLEAADGMVTLHLEHYLGISLYSETPGGEVLVRKIGHYLETGSR